MSERNVLLIKAGLFPVEYTSNRINIPVTKLNKMNIESTGKARFDRDINELIYKAFIVKSTNWSYEKEWRLIIDGQISNYFENKIPFPYAKTIYLGCKAENELIDNMIIIGIEIGANVEILQMDDKKFVLESSGTNSYKYKKEMMQWNNPFSLK